MWMGKFTHSIHMSLQTFMHTCIWYSFLFRDLTCMIHVGKYDHTCDLVEHSVWDVSCCRTLQRATPSRGVQVPKCPAFFLWDFHYGSYFVMSKWETDDHFSSKWRAIRWGWFAPTSDDDDGYDGDWWWQGEGWRRISECWWFLCEMMNKQNGPKKSQRTRGGSLPSRWIPSASLAEKRSLRVWRFLRRHGGVETLVRCGFSLMERGW